jgi:hypothetical protein
VEEEFAAGDDDACAARYGERDCCEIFAEVKGEIGERKNFEESGKNEAEKKEPERSAEGPRHSG